MKKGISGIGLVVVILLLAFNYINKNDLNIPFLNSQDTNKKIEVNSNKELVNLKWDENKYPAYYAKLNTKDLTDSDNAIIKDLKSKDKKEAFKYDGLDQLGRSGNAYGLITYESAYNHNSNVVKRPSFDSDADPSGWQDHNPKIQTGNYRGYLYNRSHSIAWSLGGSMDRENLTTGTRAQNVGTRDHLGGMKYLEDKIRNAVYNNKDLQVYYVVKPVYNNDELLPRGSEVIAYSINDNGKTFNERVYVFNAQKGVKINYQNGQASGQNLQ